MRLLTHVENLAFKTLKLCKGISVRVGIYAFELRSIFQQQSHYAGPSRKRFLPSQNQFDIVGITITTHPSDVTLQNKENTITAKIPHQSYNSPAGNASHIYAWHHGKNPLCVGGGHNCFLIYTQGVYKQVYKQGEHVKG